MPKTQEELRTYGKAYYLAHRDTILQRNAAWRTANPEKCREGHAAWLAAHPEAVQKYTAAYYANHPEAVREANTRYRATHPEMRPAADARRRARKKGAPVNDLTAAQWEEIKAAYGHRCAYCGKQPKRLTKDHITSYAEGGSHTVTNVIPACLSCNSKKHTGKPPIPVQPLLLTIAPKKQAKKKSNK